MTYPTSELTSSHRPVSRLSKKWQKKRYSTLKYKMLLAHAPDPNYSYRTMLSLFTIANDSIGITSPIFFITITFFPGAHFVYAGLTAALFLSSLIGYDFFQKNAQANDKNLKNNVVSIQNNSREIIRLIKDVRRNEKTKNIDIFQNLNKFNHYKENSLSLKKKLDNESVINSSKTFISAAGAGFICTKFITVGFFLTFNFASPSGMLLVLGYLLYATTLTLLKHKLDQTTNDYQEKIKIENTRLVACQENDLNQLTGLKKSGLNVVNLNTKLTRNSSGLFYNVSPQLCAPGNTTSHNSPQIHCLAKKILKNTNN